MKQTILIIVAALLLLGGVFGYAYYTNRNKPAKELQYIGGEQHIIPDFTFTNQLGQNITRKDVAGKIYVVEFFFCTCQSICPIMNKEMMRVQEKFKGEKNFKILSHTVNPENDSSAVLLAYAIEHHADNNQWWFLTGDKKNLYKMARDAYFVDATQGDGGPDDFVHTKSFALVDETGHVRGFYDGTKPNEVDMLMTDAQILLDVLNLKGEINSIF